MQTFKKYWPMLITLVGTLSPLFSTSVAGFWSHHPVLVASLSGAFATFKWILPSPLQK